MSGLLEVVEKIRVKPGMYLGRPSVSDLFMFLVGYEFSRSELGIDMTEEEEKFYAEFQPWLQKKFGVTTVTSWAKLIMLSCHDEKAGFEYFFKLFDEFFQRDISLDSNKSGEIAHHVSQ
ncbi:MAG: hypothetical protein RMY29_014310 [Nostoc sp. CreGUA01]|nr:hypothetical protein [Nostoc sp. CreGUA01]